MKTTKTRFCPSPTGYIHLGNLRTALFNALLARAEKGIFLLRIEDTDRERSEPKYTTALMQDLEWLDLLWQEGVEVGGENGPYNQSLRQGIYDRYYDDLLAKDMAYPCFCTEDELALSRRLQRASGKPPRYAGTCRNLTPDEIESKRAAGLAETLRFKVPKDRQIKFKDLVHGEQTFHGGDISDFIIRRANGTAPFMYCNAIDDALMGVNTALRGEDHLSNTPRQLLILESLGLNMPQYGHISLIVGSDGSPLSKRHGSMSVQDLRASGYLPVAIINYLARLGHHFTENEAVLMSLDELAANFSSANFTKSAAQFNLEQMQHWQQSAVAKLTSSDFLAWAGDSLQLVPKSMRDEFVTVVQPNVLFPQDVQEWAEVLFAPQLQFDAENAALLKAAGRDYFITLLQNCKQDVSLKDTIKLLQQRHNVKGKNLFMPLRVAFTGKTHGPELAPLFSLMPKEVVIARLEYILNDIGE